MFSSKSALKIVFGLLLLIVTNQLSAQTVSNVSASLEPGNSNNVIITYNLVSTVPNQLFRIEIRSSNDNYGAVLLNVSGDVGDNVTPGNGKRVIWRAREELGLFVGNLSFEVTSVLIVSPLRLNSPRLSDEFSPGNSIPIEWQGGFENSQIKMELFKSNIFNQNIYTSPNTGKYEWVVPGTIENGTDYKIKLYDTTAPADAVMSNNFSMKVVTAAATQTKPETVTKEKKGGGKAGWIVGGLVVAGGAAYLLLAGGEEDAPAPTNNGGGGGGGEDTFNLPSPPPTPDGSTIRKKPGVLNFSLSF
jgi:hypothetical protein